MDANDWYMMSSALASFNNTLTNNANVYMTAQTDTEDRNFSREMSDLAWERNLESWRMQNEYNLPANQYARQLEGLRQNGLNPNLVYGNSSSVGGAAASPNPYRFEGYHSTAVPRFGPNNMYQELLSTRLLQTQVAAQEAQTKLINARADNEVARNPGIVARSGESAFRWNYIEREISDSYEAGIRAQVATEYWKGVQTEYNAHFAKDRSTVQYYEAVMAEWLNTTKVPGTNLTYQQYMESFKHRMPAREYEKLKQETLDISSRIAYRKKQGELLDLKIEYQQIVNRFAYLGRTLGSDWANVLFSGFMWLFDHWNDPVVPNEVPKTAQERGASEPGDW